jgi:hypothetical protein
MNVNNITRRSGSGDWYFPTLARVWDAKTRAIVAGADRIESLPERQRADCVTALGDRVRTLADG